MNEIDILASNILKKEKYIMKNLTPQQLKEVDKCFNHVCEHIRIDKIPHQKVLFGSTVDNWFKAMKGETTEARIVIAGFPPNSNYEMAYLRVTGEDEKDG